MADQFEWHSGVVAIIGRLPESGLLRPVGAGFVVSDEGLILTCAHVLKDACWDYQDWEAEVRLRFKPGTGPGPERGPGGRAKVLPDCFRSETEGDFALLALETLLPPGVVSLELAAAGTIRQEVVMYGFPEGTNGLGADGRVVTLIPGTNGQQLQLESTNTTRGLSGGPVWSPAWRLVIGMIQTARGPDDLGRRAFETVATPSEVLAEACPQWLVLQPAEVLHPVSSDAELILDHLDRPREARPAIAARPPGSKTTVSGIGRSGWKLGSRPLERPK